MLNKFISILIIYQYIRTQSDETKSSANPFSHTYPDGIAYRYHLESMNLPNLSNNYISNIFLFLFILFMDILIIILIKNNDVIEFGTSKKRYCNN